jgi:hypothetical protein
MPRAKYQTEVERLERQAQIYKLNHSTVRVVHGQTQRVWESEEAKATYDKKLENIDRAKLRELM